MSLRKSVLLKGAFVMLLALAVGVLSLSAQTNATMRPGVYRTLGEGTNLIVLTGEGNPMNVVLRSADGRTVIARGTARFGREGAVDVDLRAFGFDNWTRNSAQQFTDSQGNVWRWVRQNL